MSAQKTSSQRFIFYISRYKKLYLAGFLLLIATNALALLIPWILRHIIDHIQEGLTSRTLLVYLILMIFIALFQAFFRMSSRIIIYTAGRNAEFDLRNDFFPNY